ncbi:uncharacterized protein LOC124494826 isoform X2 [Dermatophagoides farinae]|uniref:uncharacterized protein LOC124494826 isoform X2 n=1 Tax=Dermatophagoides farinae TaxID=6954 RepID=UPI003F6452F6
MMNNPKKSSAILNIDAENLKVTSIVDKNNHGSTDHSIYQNNLLRIDPISRTKLDTSSSPYNSIMNELIPYPSSCISTIIEKANKDGTIISSNIKESSITRAKKRSKKKGNLFKQSSQSTISQSSHDNVDGESIISSISNCQNNCASHETNSQNLNFNQSFDKLDMRDIVRRLCEKSNQSTQTNVISMVEKCNQYVQVNIPIKDSSNTVRIEQQQSNQALRNQIKQLTYIIEEMSKERSNRDLYIHQLRKQLVMMETRLKEFENEKQQQLINSEQSELKQVMYNNSETVIATTTTTTTCHQKEISSIKLENEQLKQRLNEMITIRQDELKLINEKDNVINNMTIHVNGYQQENIRLNNELLRYHQQQQQQQQQNKIETVDNNKNRKMIKDEQKDNVIVIHDNDNNKKHEQDLQLRKKDAIIVLFKHRLLAIHNECRRLQQQLNELRTTVVNNNKIFLQEKNSTKQLLSNTLMIQLLDETKSEIIRLKRMNEQLLQEKLHEKDRNIQLNCEFQSCISHLRNENDQLKQMNNVLENTLQTFQNKDEQQEFGHSSEQVNECNSKIKELEQNQLRSHEENFQLKEFIGKMEENNNVLQMKHEQLSMECEKYLSKINENVIEIEKLTKQNLELNNENEQYRKEMQQQQQRQSNDDQTTHTIIASQDDNHRSITVHYDDDGDYNINDDIKQVILQKESIIHEQEMKLIELGKQIDCLNHERLEFENRINQSLQSLQYKEMEIQRLNMAILNDDDKHHHHHHQNDNNQQLIDQRISLLEIELAKEKERSKGLSLTLAKEKLKSLEKIKQNLEQHSSSPPQQQNSL